VQWYATSVKSLLGALERLEQLKDEAEKIAQLQAAVGKAAGKGATKSPLPTAAKG